MYLSDNKTFDLFALVFFVFLYFFLYIFQSGLREELSKAKKQLENSKMELRNFYQGQVEILVQNKLKEFQDQLDQAEKTFKEELKKREMSIAKTAAAHMQQVSEK